jgi:tripartite-type tricarboxylate transporter receptor subunit TctC
MPALLSRLTLFGLALMPCLIPAYAQNYPNKPIRIVTGGAGGGGDLAARLIVQGIGSDMGQPLIIDNRFNLAGEIVSKAPSDGYTVLIEGSSFWIASLLQQTPYDPAKDFEAITWTNSAPNVLVVHPSVPVNSVKELIDLAKSKPKQLNYASAGAGGSAHLSAELFKAMTGVEIVHIPYKGSGPAVNGLIGGEVQLAFINAGTGSPHVKSGKLRALAVTSAQPSLAFPGLTTIAAAGVPGYESIQILGAFAPAKTPKSLVNRLNQEFVRALRRQDIKEKFFNSGWETVGSTPAELDSKVKSELVKWGKVIRDGGIRAD